MIRDVPEEVHEALVFQAGKNHWSVEKQALFLIKQGLCGVAPTGNTLAEATRIRARCRREVSMEEVLSFIR
jgi:plasmid stability protein